MKQERAVSLDPQGSVITAVAIAVGGNHTCALTLHWRSHVLGVNAAGELGDGTTTDA